MVIVDPRVVSPGKMHIPRCRHFPMQVNQGYNPPRTINSSCRSNTMFHQWCPRCRWWHHSLIRLPMRFRLRSFRIRLHRAKKTHKTERNGKKNRWTDAEEKILIELFGENEDKLRYRSFNSPEWQSIARQLQERCRRENVFRCCKSKSCCNLDSWVCWSRTRK